jgi:hypothetical protein
LSLAAGIAIGGAGALTFSNPAAEVQLARVQIETPMFANAADAVAASSYESIDDYAAREKAQLDEYAARGRVQVIEQSRTSALDAERAAYVTLQEQIALGLAGYSITATLVQPMFGTAADAEYATRSLVEVTEFPRRQPAAPMFSTEADAEFASRALVPESALR